MSDKFQFVENIRHNDKLKFVELPGQAQKSMLDAAKRNIISSVQRVKHA